ncbi:MAG TPA: hypothetical protein PK648_11375, partial [Verrucomicrobiales bacterium]|nr:hypothetical protein [Verrucomicrobiales bacterium]
MMSFRKIVVLLLGFVTLVVVWIKVAETGKSAKSSEPSIESSSPRQESPLAVLGRSKDHLIRAGWPSSIAEKVIALNSPRYEVLAGAAPGEIDREITKLAALKVDSEVARILERDPSTAGLLCLANSPQKAANCLLEAWGNGYYEEIKGSFVLRIDGWDIDSWAEILSRHGELAGRLIRGGTVQPELLLNYPLKNTAVADAYGAWLEDIFQGWPAVMTNPEFCLRFAYVATFGDDIREKMASDSKFLYEFRVTIWPTLLRLAEHDSGILFAEPELGVWDLFLQRSDAEALLERSGFLAADLLAGEAALPIKVREEVASYLLGTNWTMLDQIDRYRNEPLVIALIERKTLGPRYLPDLFTQLDRAGSSYPAKLRYFAKLPEHVLIEELAPIDPGAISWVPGYSTYSIIRKASQGRSVSSMDWVIAGFDVVDVVLLISPIKGASGAVQKMIREAAEGQVERTAKIVTRELGSRAAKEITEAATERQLTSLIGREVLGKVTEEFRDQLRSKGMVDITPLIQKSFN